MAEIVVDTSVAFKWFVAYGEAGLDEAATLLRLHRAGEVSLIAPTLIMIEIANTLRYVTPSAEDAIAFLDGFVATGVTLFETTPQLVRAATVRASESGMSVYDALFLALAEQRGCTLASADHRAFAGIDTPVEIRLM